MHFRQAGDLARAEAVIRYLGLRGPHDGPGEFTFPKAVEDRHELAEAVASMSDHHAARAVLDAPTRHRVTWQHQPRTDEPLTMIGGVH